jgi:poly(3-hydroxybutyrate) depolymerase
LKRRIIISLVVLVLAAIMVFLLSLKGRDDGESESTGETEKGPSGERAQLQTACIKGENSKANVVFFHGIRQKGDPLAVQTYDNELNMIAERLNLTIAVPESQWRCSPSNSKRCWGIESKGSVRAVYERVQRSVVKCFNGGSTDGVIGFSNGGYFVTRLMQLCLDDAPKWFLAIGSAGNADFGGRSDLSSCGFTSFLIGNRDITREKTRGLVRGLSRRKARVSFRVFKGGHKFLPKTVIRQLIEMSRKI